MTSSGNEIETEDRVLEGGGNTAGDGSSGSQTSDYPGNEWASVEPQREAHKWYIHRVPANLKDGHQKRFEPVVVSIGPYHREDTENQRKEKDAESRRKQELLKTTKKRKMLTARINKKLQQMTKKENDADKDNGESRKELKVTENNKRKYMHDLLSRVTEADQADGMTPDRVRNYRLTSMMEKMKELEASLRGCYSETIDLEGDEFVQMMVLDGCFILELFHKYKEMELEIFALEDMDEDDIFNNKWMLPRLSRDLVLLENQIPFQVLEHLSEIASDTPVSPSTEPGSSTQSSASPPTYDLLNLIATFFDPILPGDKNEVISPQNKGKHLLDTLRNHLVLQRRDVPDAPRQNLAHPGPNTPNTPPPDSAPAQNSAHAGPNTTDIPPQDCVSPPNLAHTGSNTPDTPPSDLVHNHSSLQPRADETKLDVRDAPPPDSAHPTFNLGECVVTFFNRISKCKDKTPRSSYYWVHTVSATELEKFGVVFIKKVNSSSLLDISFTDGWCFWGGYFTIPPFHFGRYWSVLFSNMIALEQCRRDYEDRITSYAYLLDNLINSEEDVKVLRDSKIITGSNAEDKMIADTINNLCKLAIYQDFYHDELCDRVNEYCKGWFRESRAFLYQNFFRVPWKGPSILAAIVVTVAAVAQTLHDFKVI